MKSCEEIQALIEMYLDDELTREQKHLFETHISSCNECRDALSFAKSIRQTLTALPELDVPEDFNLKIRERINKECKTSKKSFSVYARKYGALAACVVLAVVLGGRLTDIDFTKTGEQYDNFATEGTPVPTLVPDIKSIVPAENAGEEIAPTKEKKTKNVTKNTVVEDVIQTPTPDAEATEFTTDVSEAPATEGVPSMASLDTIEELPSPSPEAQASGGGGGSARAAQLSVTPDVTITVKAEHTLAAITLAEEFATIENGIYTADKDGFKNLLEAYDVGGVSYTLGGVAKSDTVVFVIYTE